MQGRSVYSIKNRFEVLVKRYKVNVKSSNFAEDISKMLEEFIKREKLKDFKSFSQINSEEENKENFTLNNLSLSSNNLNNYSWIPNTTLLYYPQIKSIK